MSILRWRGVMAKSRQEQRIVAAFVSCALSATLILTQCAYVGIGLSGSYAAFAYLLLLPISLGALLLGTVSGTVIGLLAGAIQYAHSIIMPLDFHELALITPLSSIVLLGICGFLLGVLFALVFRKERTHTQAFTRIALSCLVVSGFFSMAFGACALLLEGDAEVARLSGAKIADILGRGTTSQGLLIKTFAIQACVDAWLMTLLCFAMYCVVRHAYRMLDNIGLRTAFRLSILLVFGLAVLLTTTLSFVTVTNDELREAEAAIRSETNYLCIQIASLTGRAEEFLDASSSPEQSSQELTAPQPENYQHLVEPVSDLLVGYTMEQTGTVAIIVDDTLLLTDDARLPLGCSITEILGEDIRTAIDTGIETDQMQLILYDGILSSEGDTGGHSHNTQVGYLMARKQGAYTVMIVEPSSMVYRNRAGVIGREAHLSFVLLVAVFLLISVLLDKMVARRIDSTNEALQRVTEGFLDTKVDEVGTREFKSLSRGINFTVAALKNWIDEAESRMASELSAARSIQEAVLPNTFPPFPEIESFDIYAAMHPAREVGGDFYDFFLLENDDEKSPSKLAFAIADVSGKGIPASLFMMRAKALICDYILHGIELGHAIMMANEQLCDGNDADMFVTAWIGVLDYHTGHVDFVNAGHNPPLVRHAGSWCILQDRSGLPLGVFGGMPYRVHSLDLQPGDKVFTYTDGVTEAMNSNGELYGEERLLAVVQENDTSDPQTLVEVVYASVKVYAGEDTEQSDDITMLALELKGVEDA